MCGTNYVYKEDRMIMKKSILIASIGVFLSLISIGQSHLANLNETPGKNFKSMIGLWEIVGEQDSKGALEIIDSATILIRFMGEEKKLLNYKIDFSKSPFWFDFSTRDTVSTQSFKCLIDFVNEDMLKWEVFDGERSEHFTASTGDLFYLKRVRSKSNKFVSSN